MSNLVTAEMPVLPNIQASIGQVTYLSNLTPLRGVAALLTVIFHANLMVGFALTKDLNLLNRMYLMVDFFFILSGFIMCHVYGEKFANGVSRQAFKKFTIARFSRVYPLHFVTLMYLVVLFGVSGYLGIPPTIVEMENSRFSFVTNLLLLQSMNLHQWFSWVHASWSISTEWWAYMIFPFLVVPFMKLNAVGRFLVCLLCFGGYLCITFLLVPIVKVPPSIPFVAVNPADLSINVAYQYGFVRCLCGFILGMMMYLGFRKGWGQKILGNGFTMVTLALAAFMCMQFNLPDIITVSFLPLILLSGSYGSKNINAVFRTRALQKLGEWSFSIYLVHQPIMFTIGSIMAYLNPTPAAGLPPAMPQSTAWLICAAFVAVVLLVASVSYRFLEVPARNWINRKGRS